MPYGNYESAPAPPTAQPKFDRAAVDDRISSLNAKSPDFYPGRPEVALRMVGVRGSDSTLSWVLVFHDSANDFAGPANLPPDVAADAATGTCDAVLFLDAADGGQLAHLQFCGPTQRARDEIDAGKRKPVVGYGQS